MAIKSNSNNGSSGQKVSTASISSNNDNSVQKASTVTVSRGSESGYKSWSKLTVNSSAYTSSCVGCSGITSTGIDLIKNPNIKLIAVDPSVIPLGKKVYVEGYGYAITGDTGGAIKGHKIDVLVTSKSKAMAWGRKNVTIYVQP